MSKLFDTTRRTECAKVVERLLAAAISRDAPRLKRSRAGLSFGWQLGFRDKLDFRLLHVWSDGRVTEESAMVTLSRMKEENKTALEDFESIHGDWIAQLPPISSWRLLAPLRITTDAKLPMEFRILGTRLRLVSWDAGIQGIGRKRIKETFQASRIPTDKREAKYLVVAGGLAGRGALDAASEFEIRLDAFRGLMEFTLGCYATGFSWPFRGMRSVPHPAWALAWNKREKELYPVLFQVDDLVLRDAERNSLKDVPLEQRHLDAVRDNTKQVLPQTADVNDTRALIADAMRLYVQALDSYSEDQAFLSLWRCAEVIAATDERSSNEAVCAHVSAVIQQTDIGAGIADLMKDYAKRRNGIVHRGLLGRISQEELRTFKLLCDVVIGEVMSHVDSLPTRQHVQRFFKLLCAHDRQLKVEEDVLAQVRARRDAK